MESDLFFMGLVVSWFVFRLILWRRSNINATERLKRGDTEIANDQTRKQPLIYISVSVTILIERYQGTTEVHPLMTYTGLAVLCLGLALLTNQFQSGWTKWTERLFFGAKAGGNARESDLNQKPWIAWWPLRLELIGMALFCGAPVGALIAWVFCMAHGRALRTTLAEK